MALSMADQSYVLGIDIGGTNFRLGLVKSDLSIDHFEKKSSSILTGGDGIANLAQEIDNYISAHTQKEQIEAVVVGFPSSVSKDRTTLYNTPNLAGFNNMDVAHPLRKALGLPVYIEKDVNLLLLYDIHHLHLDPSKSILGFYVGTGFGNALYLNGDFYTGKNGATGELGHIPLYGLDKRCNCGNLGCAETICSGMGLNAIAAQHFPEEEFSKLFVNHGASEVLRQYVATLAIPIATELTLLDPDYAVIGGGVVAMEGFPQEYFVECIKDRTRKPYPASNLDIRFSKGAQQSGVIGGALCARRIISRRTKD